MRALEAEAIGSGRATGLALMERAATGVVAGIETAWPGFLATPRRVVILAGPGNNGGDAFAVARLLADAGHDVSVWELGDPRRLPEDAAENRRRWLARGGVAALDEPGVPAALAEAARADLVIDGLFGIGLSRPIEGPAAALIEGLDALDPAPRVVAIDIPSGVAADSGEALGGRALHADLCVTFHAPKPAHLAPKGAAWMDRVLVADIGLHDDGAAGR